MDEAPKVLPKPPVAAPLKENVLAAGELAPNAGVELAPNPNPGVLAGLAPKDDPNPPKVEALLAGAAVPKPPKGALLGVAPKAGVEEPKGLGDGVPNGDADDAGLAPNGDEVLAPKPPKLGVAPGVPKAGVLVAAPNAGVLPPKLKPPALLAPPNSEPPLEAPNAGVLEAPKPPNEGVLVAPNAGVLAPN